MEPFLKWAGGKRWLVSKNSDLLPGVESFHNYFEPFLGGAAVFFHLKPQFGVLSDLNAELINTYEVIRNDWQRLFSLLQQYHNQHNFEFYYKMRARKPRLELQQAARFIYLNRTCWNGLYRVNQQGKFNVPIGTKDTVIFPHDNFQELSRLLQNIEIISTDFEDTIEAAGFNDFIFVDPPYTVKHNLNGFIKYNEKIFSWDDQVRLKDCIVRAINRGAKVLVLNANHKSIKELYRGVGDMQSLNRASVISGSPTYRGTYSELAIKCW